MSVVWGRRQPICSALNKAGTLMSVLDEASSRTDIVERAALDHDRSGRAPNPKGALGLGGLKPGRDGCVPGSIYSLTSA
jgi:hypothetical protein